MLWCLLLVHIGFQMWLLWMGLKLVSKQFVFRKLVCGQLVMDNWSCMYVSTFLFSTNFGAKYQISLPIFSVSIFGLKKYSWKIFVTTVWSRLVSTWKINLDYLLFWRGYTSCWHFGAKIQSVRGVYNRIEWAVNHKSGRVDLGPLVLTHF